jgi:filamentous hemagglutinin family protein
MEVPMTLRPALLLGCALGALTLPSQARAQAFNANPATVAGTVGYDRATLGVETITIDSPSAIINWFPNVGGNPIIFLPAGNVATFINGNNTGNFAVLNRIQTNVPVRFDGTVIGRLQDPALGTSVPGGTIIFQGPNGIIVGPKALFDVGNLVLTTLTVATDGANNFIDPTGAIQFLGGFKAPNAAVITLPGSQIRALEENSYVAMIAPVVQHGGSVRVNGSAAFVAGEEVLMRVNAGLFDIIVTVGSDNAVPLIHTGATGGPASTGGADNHGIYLVAVPKNQAITAILEGNAGFDPAVNAVIENGAIVLSAGYPVVNGMPDRFGESGIPPVPGRDASFHIRGGTITSDLFGFAVTDMLASGATSGSLTFQQDVSLFGGARAHLFAGLGQTVTVGGNALVSAARNRTIALNPIDLAGGEALIFSTGGTIDIFGNAIVDASAQGVVDPAASIAGNGTGGNAGIFADRGSVRVRGATRVLATGAGGVLDLSPNRGGTGVGGNARVEGINGGLVRLDGDLAMDASGTGSRSNGSANPGANGTGGDVRVAAVGGGRVIVAGAPTLTSNGTGGDVTGGTVFAGGTGRGGTVSLLANGIVTFAGNPALAADGAGGTGPNGGVALGGTINLAATPVPGGPVTSTLNAGNVTGSATATGAAAGGNGPGAWHVTAIGGSIINLANLTLSAAANGTPATLPFSSLEPRGGIINVTQAATLTTPGEIRVIADGAGRFQGGSLTLNSGDDVTITHASPAPGGVTIDVTDFFVNAADDVSVAAGAVTRSANRTDIRAGDLASVGGRVLGRDLRIASADIDLTGALGDAGTQVATLQVNPTTQPATLGGAAQGPGYTLTNAEAGRIRADTLRINVPALGANVALFVRDLAFTGGGAAAGIGTLVIGTPGIARVEGNLAMTGARAADGIALTAVERLEIVTPGASIRVRDGAGAPAGTMILTSNNLWVASAAILGRLRLDPNYAGRDADLLDNGGADVPRGYVEAGGVTLATGGTLFVQNTGFGMGTFATGLDFAGITVGPGGLTIIANAPASQVTAFGRRLNPDGSFTTGYDFFFAVDYRTGGAAGGAGRYTAASTFNTCIIVTGQCPARPPNDTIPGRDPTTGPTGGSASIQLPFGAEQDDLVDTSFAAEPLIEEPVTSGGESTLWDPDCDRDHDGDCDEVHP